MTHTSLPILPAHLESLPPAWEALFEAIEDGVCVQTLDGRIARANHAFAELMGLPLNEIIGHECSEVLGCKGESDHVPAFCARNLSSQTQEPASEELRGRTPGQRLRARISPVRNEAGVVVAYVMVVRDITDVVARERELARVEQLARLGELAAGLAHEIKNPLAGIQGAMDILLSRRDAQDPERQVLEGVKREVERINHTVHLLLDRARPRALQLQPVPLNEIVQRAVNLARASVPAARRAQIQLNFRPHADNLVLTLDGAQIEDAVLNLLLNAVDAIDGHGTINVELRRDAVPETVIEIADTGRGINDEDMPRIFSPFFTTHQHGTGLGLPAVRRIARAHGGRVEVRSTPGQGSVFSLHLPHRDV
jgi:PAS domain S-box-containing protein